MTFTEISEKDAYNINISKENIQHQSINTVMVR